MNRDNIAHLSEGSPEAIAALTSRKPAGRIRRLFHYLGSLASSRDFRYAQKCLQMDRLLAQTDVIETENKRLADRLSMTQHLLSEQAFEKANLEKIISREQDTTFEVLEVAGSKVLIGCHDSTPVLAAIVLFVPSISDKSVGVVSMGMQSLNFVLEHISIHEHYLDSGLSAELIGAAVRYSQKKGAHAINGDFTKYEDGALPWQRYFINQGFATTTERGLKVKMSLVAAASTAPGLAVIR